MTCTTAGELSMLPPECFVGFEAYRIRAPELLWENKRIPSIDIPNCCFATPISKLENHLFKFTESKTFMADRYGGQGLGDGGGSGRCGFDGRLQIKGIGKTPLARNEDNYFHSYGGMALSEAILEAIWGEVCSIALPYGGVRTHAIICTGSNVPIKFKRTNGPDKVPRAVAVRQAALRPAHFIRAPFFCEHEARFPGSLDAKRTKAAVAALPAILGELFVPNALDLNAVDYGLKVVISRAARQLAVARSRKIMHGSLTASNVTLDGRWLDFGSISTVADYAKIIIPRGAPHFLAEEQLILRAIEDLAFFVNRFGPPHNNIASSAALTDSFIDIFRGELSTAFCCLSGAEDAILAKVGANLRRAYSKVIEDLFDAQAQYAQLILSTDNDVLPTMPRGLAPNNIPAILSATAFCQTEAQFFAATRELIASERLRHRFAQAGAALRAATATTPEALVLQAARCLQRNSTCEVLFRTSLYPKIDALVEEGGDVCTFIEEVVNAATEHFREDENVPVPIREIRGLHYCGSSHSWRIGNEQVAAASAAEIFRSNGIPVPTK